MPVQQKRNVAIFLDMENLFGGYGRDVSVVPLGKLVQDIESEVRAAGLGGGTALARAYANWSLPDMAGYRGQLLTSNIKPVQVFSFENSSKNAADIELVVDALEVAADMPWIELFVIVSGDGDYVPLIRRLHALGRRTFVATTSQPAAGIVNKLLPAVADHFRVIDVSPAPEASTKKTPPVKAVKVTAVPAVKKTPPARKATEVHQELMLYKASVNQFIKDDPTLWVNGQVNAQRLGTLLRQKWPEVTYKTFGFATLTKFVEESCGLETIRPAAVEAVR